MYLAPQDILYEGTWKDNFLDGKGTVSKPLQIIQIETINGKISKKGSTIVQDPIKEESESSDLVFSLYF